MNPQMTQEEFYKKIEQEWDFEKLIEPYRHGGPNRANEVRRSWGTIIDWLINRRHFPPEVVGAGIFLTWMQVKRDGHFKPDFNSDGKEVWDSAGNKFVQSIKAMCASVAKQQMSMQIFSGMAGKIEEQIKIAFRGDFWTMTPWFVKMFSVKYWKYRIENRRFKKNG